MIQATGIGILSEVPAHDLRTPALYLRRPALYYRTPALASELITSTARDSFPETVRVLRDLLPLHVTPDLPVFTTTEGQPIEPKTFSDHWYDCLRALGLRVRGLYCTKDTYVSHALQKVGSIEWVEQQTGVAYARSSTMRVAPEPGSRGAATVRGCDRGRGGRN
jgi:hypothetical protein